MNCPIAIQTSEVNVKPVASAPARQKELVAQWVKQDGKLICQWVNVTAATRSLTWLR